MKSRAAWMIAGPAQIAEMQRTIESLQRQIADMQAKQDAELADIRASVAGVIDDVAARLGALDAATS